MLITGLNINTQNPKTATFVDVTDDHWAYKEIEASKTYMTWYNTSGGKYFKPNDGLTREECAVALIRTLWITDSNDQTDVLSSFQDRNDITKVFELRSFIGIK